MISLDAEAIRRLLDAETAGRLASFDAFDEIGSTNSYLMQQPRPEPGRARVALTDNQTAGRGRHGRTWVAPRGSGICLSMSYTFGRAPENLPALTLAIGMGVIDALSRHGIGGIGLKWPNDLIAADGKLGGILTEAQAGSGGAMTIVTGVGINVDLGDGLDIAADDRAALGVADLATFASSVPSGDGLAAALIDGLCATFLAYESSGFAAFARRWAGVDWLLGRELTVSTAGENRIAGVGAGLADDGALLVSADDGRLHRVTSGTVELGGEPH